MGTSHGDEERLKEILQGERPATPLDMSLHPIREVHPMHEGMESPCRSLPDRGGTPQQEPNSENPRKATPGRRHSPGQEFEPSAPIGFKQLLEDDDEMDCAESSGTMAKSARPQDVQD